MTDFEKKRIWQLFSQFSDSLEEVDVDPIYSKMVRQSLKAGQLYNCVGDNARHIGFVCKGLFKDYVSCPNGTIYIRRFCDAGNFVGSYAHLLSKSQSPILHEAIEDSVVLSFDYGLIEALSQKDRKWLEFSRRYAESHYLMKDQREYELFTLKAGDRYLQFLEDFPHLTDRLSQTDIASYIGVTPESLSRLRKQLRIKIAPSF